jgi:predicted lipoprotein with Yx(FWY)xxD motif
VRRILILMAAMAAILGLAAALASASARRAALELRRTGVGTILVNARGFTLYAFTRDARNRDVCVKIQGCPGAWPAVTTGGWPIAGRGVHSRLIGTITLKGGVRQVTYAGHPLYTYVGDSGPGQTFYVGVSAFGGSWPAVNAAGSEVR